MGELAFWFAICAPATLLVLLGTLVWRLATRLSVTEASADRALQRADTAALSVMNNLLKIENVASELAAHREEVAKEYVSYKHMTNLENRLVDAIGALGSRIDALFSRIPHG